MADPSGGLRLVWGLHRRRRQLELVAAKLDLLEDQLQVLEAVVEVLRTQIVEGSSAVNEDRDAIP
jgi:hypothetical protein